VSTESIIPNAHNREARLKAAEQRVEFWAIWEKESTDPEAWQYFRRRKHYWTHVIHGIHLEQDPLS
jgi:hypothetical protein